MTNTLICFGYLATIVLTCTYAPAFACPVMLAGAIVSIIAMQANTPSEQEPK